MKARNLIGWLLSIGLLGGLVSAAPAWCAGWPEKPVKIIVPFAPGGSADASARILAHGLGDILGQQFVVENKGGASGMLAAMAVARAPADGYTLFWATLTQIAIVPAVQSAPYDPAKDFAPITLIGTNPFVLFVNQSVPVKTLKEFVEYVKKHPGEITYAAAGAGSQTHLLTELFLHRAGLHMIPVMYKGSGPAMNDVRAGHVKSFFTNLAFALPYANGGPIRLLAVSSEHRVTQLPNVPTFIESGYPGFTSHTWNGLMAPAGTPPEIIDKIVDAAKKSESDPKVRALLANNGVDPNVGGPEAFAATIKADMKTWSDAVKLVGLHLK